MTSALSAVYIAIYDFNTGRVLGGADEDYLSALEKALCDFRPATLAPYRCSRDNAPLDLWRLAPGSSWRRLWLGFSLCRRYLRGPRPALLLFPFFDNKEDILAFFLATLACGWRRRGMGVFVLRRSANWVGRDSLKARIKIWIFRRFARTDAGFFVSDSRAAMDYWRQHADINGPILSLPVRAVPDGIEHRPDKIFVAFLGVFRAEKGAAHYDSLISRALAYDPKTVVTCQLTLNVPTVEEENWAVTLRDKWKNDPRVQLFEGHLETQTYNQLLHQADIVILPYNVKSYGVGTSGVLFEAMAAGAVVVSARFLWAVQEYELSPNIVWLDSLAPEALNAALDKAFARLRARTGRAAPADDMFRASWIVALEQAATRI